MLGENGHPKDPRLEFLSLLLEGKSDKNLLIIYYNLGHFLYCKVENGHPKPSGTHLNLNGPFFLYICQDGKTATQKPTTRISVAFALGQKRRKNLYKK